MDLGIFKGIKGVGLLRNYTNEETLKLLYAIGWQNNFNISSTYVINRCINNANETPSYNLYKGDVADNINVNLLNSRSMHTKCIISNVNSESISKQIQIAILENCAVLKNIVSSDNIIILLSQDLAKALINNEATYNSLNVEEHKKAGEAIAYLGTLGNYQLYINLIFNEDDRRILGIYNKDLSNKNSYLTNYIELQK